jgi:hypothetical protein
LSLVSEANNCWPQTLHVLLLLWLGRIGMSSFGFGIWTNHAWSSDTSQLLFDPYSVSHVLHGIIFYLVLRYLAPNLSVPTRLMLALGIEIGWEILENSPLIIDRYRTATAALDYYGDSILNSIGDSLSCMMGFWLAYKLPWKFTLALVVAMEVIMLLTIRDNLTLNVLMLIHPIKSIQVWQMAHP